MSAQRPSETVQAAPERAEPVRAGVVGLGYWGPNLARNLAAIPGCDLAWLCDPREGAAAGPSRSFPGTRVTGDISDLLGDPSLDAVLLATIPSTSPRGSRNPNEISGSASSNGKRGPGSPGHGRR